MTLSAFAFSKIGNTFVDGYISKLTIGLKFPSRYIVYITLLFTPFKYREKYKKDFVPAVICLTFW